MNPQTHANSPGGQQAGTTITLDDIYFTIFRHKKILLACLCLGLIGVVAVRFVKKPTYSSQAKLLVHYVLETMMIDPANKDAHVIAPGSSDSILNTEKEILTSRDVAEQVAQVIGPEKILAMKGGGTNLLYAAGVIASGVSVVASHQSDTMFVTFEHPDPKIVQPVLNALIQAYLIKHIKVHQEAEFSADYYSEQLIQLRKSLATTEGELQKLLAEANVISVPEAKKMYISQIENLKRDMLAARAKLYAKRGGLGKDTVSIGNTNSGASSIPADKLEDYENVLVALDALKKNERQLILNYTEIHPQVTGTRERIAQLKQTKTELEEQYSDLALTESVSTEMDAAVERAKIADLAAMVEGLEILLTNVQAEAFTLQRLEPRISEKERQRDQEAKNYEFYLSGLNKASSVGEAKGGKVPNITIVEKPTPPRPNNKKLLKMMGAVFVGFLGLGCGIAALIDFVIDRTVKRSVDVRRHMRMPFFLAIPNTCWDGRIQLPKLPFGKLAREGSKNGTVTNGALAPVMPPWDPNHHLRLYAEGLRERLITYFEVNGFNHKPKLVGVTSCGEGSGVTTLASGLASALSKTGDGNVLLVDMNGGYSATHSFHKGKPGGGLADALEPEGRVEAQVQENLYLMSLHPSSTPIAGTSDNESPKKLLPSRFNSIMPQLKASDYDYVIFDMPPVTPTSVTPRLASNMDMVLLVLESERTPQEAAIQADTLLADARAKAAVVLNKCRQHVPKLLSHGL